MAQHDYDIANAAGASFRADLNTALAAIVSQNSGDTAPTTTFAYQWWADTTSGILKQRNSANSAWISICTLSTGVPVGLVIGTDVQAYDADTAKTDVAQNFTVPQRSAILTDNDGSFDLSAKQNFKCTPSAGVTLTFTNQADGLSGSVILINGANYAISAHANTKISTTALARISASGTYRVDYISDGTNAYCTASESLA
ncbi:MAG: hypothetical protein KJ787_13875 [Gammaproteobacteria bacterium]|nr:hypothetical protein [Gammaproteobacteria bacterium]MBU1647415.1 hypothetical protein [Gammaproteobacteria bacterium]MBU1973207.1 hypothetical protein [Gammaproteobacteria bacterium]